MNDVTQQSGELGQIEIRTSRRGIAKPYIAGTRISVENIYVCHELQGMSPNEIVASYPHLSLSQIHSALAWYFEHPDAIRRQLKESEEFAERCEAEQESTRFSELRDAVVST